MCTRYLADRVGLEGHDRRAFLAAEGPVVVVGRDRFGVREVADPHTDEFGECDGLSPGRVQHAGFPPVHCRFLGFEVDVDTGPDVLAAVECVGGVSGDQLAVASVLPVGDVRCREGLPILAVHSEPVGAAEFGLQERAPAGRRRDRVGCRFRLAGAVAERVSHSFSLSVSGAQWRCRFQV